MLPLLTKLFVRSFYKANAGFFLFFFFVFFASVPGGAMVKYHSDIMHGILGSLLTVSLVLFCWLLYHFKCAGFIVKIINSPEGNFLYNLQAVKKRKQWMMYLLVYTMLYAPVLIYSIVLCIVGVRTGYGFNAFIVAFFQVISLIGFTTVVHYRLNNWIRKISLPSLHIRFRKSFRFYTVYYFLLQKRTLFLVLKSFSLLLLYIVLVWNNGKYSSDSFLLFYLVILMAHAILPYLSVQFMENSFAISRNLPLPLYKRATTYLLSFALFLLPELAYILYHAQNFSIEHRLAYYVNLVVSLFLLTAVQYSDAFNRNEYMKASFGLFFVSIFALHIQAFWVWIGVQVVIGVILFRTGFYRYEQVQ